MEVCYNEPVSNQKRNFCVLFAGPVGSSKTPIAHYLSCELNLPIFSNNSIRTEVRADLLAFNNTEYQKRKIKRLQKLLNSGNSFIYNASLDRKWEKIKEMLLKSGYKYFIISLDLSHSFLANLCTAKGYSETLQRIGQLITDHEEFLTKYSGEVNLHITDQNFKERLELSKSEFDKWLKKDDLI